METSVLNSDIDFIKSALDAARNKDDAEALARAYVNLEAFRPTRLSRRLAQAIDKLDAYLTAPQEDEEDE